MKEPQWESKAKENHHKQIEAFVRENYPIEKSSYEMQELINSGLDGLDVFEQKDQRGELEGIATYSIGKDNEENTYLSLGIILTREESQGEGVMKSIFSQIKQIAIANNCDYITAIPDTEAGEAFLTSRGFEWTEDPVNKREYLRFEID